MGILNDFKRLFWAKKAVAKNTARKVGDEAKDLAEEGFEKVKDFSHKVADKAGDLYEDTKEYTSDLMDEILKRKDTDTPPTSGFADTPSSQDTPKKDSLVDKAVEMSDKAWEKAEDVGEKVWEKAEDLAGKAKDMVKKAGERIDEKLDEMLEKAKDLDKTIEAERDAIDKNRDGFADKPVNEKLREQGSLLEGKDDFWAKADQYGKGDYSMGKPVVTGKTEPPADQKLELKPLKGFTDRDGDGDPLIDDAEIVDDDTPPKNT